VAQSGRFSLSLRILAVLAASPKAMHTSTAIAEELSESAVMVRRHFLLLERRGLIEQRRGPGGGAKLKAAAREIGLGDVYLAAEGDWLESRNLSVSSVLRKARQRGVSAMNETTLAQILKRMGKKKTTSSTKAERRPAKGRIRKVAALSKRGRNPEGRVRENSRLAIGVDRKLRSLVSATEVRSH
jgi:DNA-binding IscR family transcriptional regulator